MKSVSQNFINKVRNPVKSVNSKAFFSWERQIDPERGFFILDISALDGPEILWNGNQQSISFMDRYKYDDESFYLKSWSVSKKVSNNPWGVILSTADITLNNASGKFFPRRPGDTELLSRGVLNNFNGYKIEDDYLVEEDDDETEYTAFLEITPGKTYIVKKQFLGEGNRLRVGTATAPLLNGGLLIRNAERDMYETATITAGDNDTVLYINYASNHEMAVKSMESLSVREMVENEYAGLPNRPVKIQVEIDGESINLFTGFTSRPEISVVDSTYHVMAYDALAFLSSKTSSLEAQINKRIDAIIKELLVEAGFAETQLQLEPGLQSQISYAFVAGENTMSLLEKLCESEQYLIFADGDGNIHGWNADHNYGVIPGAAVWRANFDNASSIGWGTTSIINDVRVTPRPYRIVDDSVFYEEEASNDDWLVPANGSVDIFVALKDANNNSLYAISYGTPTYNAQSGSSYLTNTKLDGSGPTNHNAISLDSIYNFGNTIKLTFSNSSATPTYITKIKFAGSSAQVSELESVEATDSDSIDDYGRNPDDNGTIYEVESIYIQDRTFAGQIASRIVDLYANPLHSVDSSIFFAPQLELGDQVLASLGVFGEHDTIIFGVEMSGDAEANYSQKLLLEERDTSALFKLDISRLDGLEVLG